MSFIKRNKPIFVIGLIAAIAFIVIIIMGQSNESGISLTQVIQSRFNVEERPLSLPNPPDELVSQTQEAIPEELPLLPPPPESPKVTLDVKEITFTEEGFEPSSTQAVQGQIVRWINNTDKPIIIRELISKHEEFKIGVTILALETAEFELKGSGFWTFKETGSGHIGKILIIRRSSQN